MIGRWFMVFPYISTSPQYKYSDSKSIDVSIPFTPITVLSQVCTLTEWPVKDTVLIRHIYETRSQSSEPFLEEARFFHNLAAWVLFSFTNEYLFHLVAIGRVSKDNLFKTYSGNVTFLSFITVCKNNVAEQLDVISVVDVYRLMLPVMKKKMGELGVQIPHQSAHFNVLGHLDHWEESKSELNHKFH